MITKQKALWQEAFGESRESVDRFFATGYDKNRCVTIYEGEQLVSALYWLDYAWQGKKLAYLYAVATAADFRGRGYGKQLMEKAHQRLQEQGYVGAALVPADMGLAEMYEKLGYRVFSRVKTVEIAPQSPAVKAEKISAEAYAALRQARCPQAPQPSAELYRYFETYGALYKAEGCLFAAAKQEDTLYFQEFLGDPQALGQVVGALRGEKGIARLPGGETPFGMYYPLAPGEMPEYLAFALD